MRFLFNPYWFWHPPKLKGWGRSILEKAVMECCWAHWNKVILLVSLHYFLMMFDSLHLRKNGCKNNDASQGCIPESFVWPPGTNNEYYQHARAPCKCIKWRSCLTCDVTNALSRRLLNIQTTIDIDEIFEKIDQDGSGLLDRFEFLTFCIMEYGHTQFPARLTKPGCVRWVRSAS